MTLLFPQPVTEFMDSIPHRPPFVWIDEVLEVSPEGGVAAVTLKVDGLYIGPDGLRRSSYLEFMAQGFAYVRAAQSAAGFFGQRPPPKKAFLASINDGVYADESLLRPALGSRLTIEISGVREVGPITLFAAVVRATGGAELARARLKVFSE